MPSAVDGSTSLWCITYCRPDKRLATCMPQASSLHFGRLYVNGPDLSARARHYATRSPQTVRQSALLQSSAFVSYYINKSIGAAY